MKTINEFNNTLNKMDKNIALANEKKVRGFVDYMNAYIKDSKQEKEDYNFTSLKSAKKHLVEKLEGKLNSKMAKIFSIIYNCENKKIKFKREKVTLKSYNGFKVFDRKIIDDNFSVSDLEIISKLKSKAKINEFNALMDDVEDENYVMEVLTFIEGLKVEKTTTKKVVNVKAL